MTDIAQGEALRPPYWKTAALLWAVSLIGLLSVFPYVATLEATALTRAAARLHLGLVALLALSFAQSAVLLAIAVLVGLWAARKLGFATPLVAAFLSKSPAPRHAFWTLILAGGLGVGAAIVLLWLDREVFAPIPSVAVLIRHAASGATHPPTWQRALACLYGGLDEEMLMRLGLLSLVALILRTISRGLGGRRDVLLSAGVFWMANITTAIAFGLGHLPATAALAPLSAALVVRAIVLNGFAGLVFGALYRRFGLEWAMVSHLSADVVLQLVAS